MHATAYLFFDGTCAAALDFYKQAAGAVVGFAQTYGASPACEQMPPEMHDKILHASFRIGDTTLMASDCPPGQAAKFGGFGIAISVDSVAECESLFAAMSAGGQVFMPLASTFFAESFGQFVDKFGVSWMVICEKKAP